MMSSKTAPTVDLSEFDNSWYQPGNTLKRFLWYFCNLLFLKTSLPFPSSFKRCLLLVFGAKVGHGPVIKPNVNIKFPWFLELGDNVWIGEGVWIDNLAQVVIGNNVCISQGAYLLTGNHDYRSRTFDLIVKPIEIQDGAWIGARAIVCPGVTVKSHSVLTVGSILTKSTEAWMIYSGIAAKAVKVRTVESKSSFSIV